ncbi:MAG: hypothetical protein ABIH69_07900 [bacterium]|nr:hypothetical protein [Candidatus Margulisiibacteriota bacterium]
MTDEIKDGILIKKETRDKMQLDLKERYIVDEKGKKKSVVLDIKEFKKIVQIVEDLGDLRHIVKHRKEKKIHLDDFISKLEKANLV